MVPWADGRFGGTVMAGLGAGELSTNGEELGDGGEGWFDQVWKN